MGIKLWKESVDDGKLGSHEVLWKGGVFGREASFVIVVVVAVVVVAVL